METLSLFPLDPRCALLTNLVWAPDDKGVPSLHRQKSWVRFPRSLRCHGFVATFGTPVGRVRVETAEDEAGATWRLLAEAELNVSPQTLSWPQTEVNNLRVHVVEPSHPAFPNGYTFSALHLLVEADDKAWPSTGEAAVASRPLEDRSPAMIEPFAGDSGVHPNERLGLCHDRPQTNRVHVTTDSENVTFVSPLLRLGFSRTHALVTRLGWDTYGQGRQGINLLSTAHTRGAFPVVLRDTRRCAAESSGGTFAVSGRTVIYRGIRPVPELEWNYAYTVREKGFSLTLEWRCDRTLYSSELAALRIPFDLYRSVVHVLAMPDVTGPSGLVSLPLAINAPNHGVMRVTAREGDAPVFGRILPLRTQAELWLDLIPGAKPLPNGLFEMPAGAGKVTLDFELTKIFPFGRNNQSDLFGWWEMPPFYSFAERENLLGALTDAWLTGLAFRPDFGRFANNSVADSAAACASYYADIAAYTPPLADGLDPRQFVRFAAEQLLRDTAGACVYSDWHKSAQAAGAPLDCAWLYVASAGDWEWARRWRDGIRFYAQALLESEWKNTGLVASSFSGVPEEDGYMGAAWCDSIRSGHLESYVNAATYRSLGRAADLLGRLDEGALAGQVRTMADRLKASFMGTFFDAASNQIVQWVSRDGRKFGFGSHMHLGAAVALGLVPEAQARDLLRGYLARLAAGGFTRFEWGLPIFLDPVPAVCHNNWKGKGVEPDGTDQIGVYMNGGIHMHQTYFILQALYRTGMRHEANELFMKMTPLVRRGELCGGLHSGLDWRHPVDGRPSGYEGLLAEQFHFLLAAITGYLGVEYTIDGLVIRGPDTDRIRRLRPNFGRMANA